MAVKQQVTDDAPAEEITVNKILHHLDAINRLNLSRPELTKELDNIICILGEIQISAEANSMKTFKENIKNIYEEFTKQQYSEDILNICLRSVYKIITTMEKPSPAASIILKLFDCDHIPKAIQWLFNGPNISDEAIKKCVKTLCLWIKINLVDNLYIWILHILKGLKEQGKMDLLLTISNSHIDELFKLTVIPYLNLQTLPIVSYMLQTFNHRTDVLLQKVAQYFYILPKIENNRMLTNQQKTFMTDFSDIILTLVGDRPNYINLSKETMDMIQKYATTYDYDSIVVWNDVSQIYVPNSNVRVGLVNLGNTCYMNSILQALVMTKPFSREILMSSSTDQLLQNIQKLLALLLHSARPELTPREVLHTARPPGFHPGHQQDSSEFLGHLLDTLHEEEKLRKLKYLRRNHYNNNTTTNNNNNINNNNNNNNNINNNNDMDIDDDLNTIKEKLIFNNNTNNINNRIAAHTDTNNSIEENEQQLINGETLIQKTFSGKLSIIYKCLNCGVESKHYDSFRELQLSFPEHETNLNGHHHTPPNYSVQDLLDYYCSPEKLIGDNRYYCEQCETLCDGERYINIIESPKNLIITLKHFKYDQKYNVRAKLMHKVYHDDKISIHNNVIMTTSKTASTMGTVATTITSSSTTSSSSITTTTTSSLESTSSELTLMKPPSSPLPQSIKSSSTSDDLSTNTIISSSLINYVLYAAVVHSGVSMDSGHYYTYAADQSGWYKFNDNFVTKSSISDLHNLKPPNTPYILFYQMESMTSSDDGSGASGGGGDSGVNNCTNISPNKMLPSNFDTLQRTGKTTNFNENLMKRPNNDNIDHHHHHSLSNDLLHIDKKNNDLPSLDELPIFLRDYVNAHNTSYLEETRLASKKIKMRSTTIKKFHDSNNDDPPNSCGGNAIDQSNPYIC